MSEKIEKSKLVETVNPDYTAEEYVKVLENIKVVDEGKVVRRAPQRKPALIEPVVAAPKEIIVEKVERAPEDIRSKRIRELEYLRDKDRVPVRGVFRFHEVPGGQMSFSCKFYKGDQVESYTMHDGEIYTVPLGVAKHLNKNLKYPIHGYLMDENNKPTMKINQWVRRCSFQSLEFVDIEEFTTGSIVLASNL